MQARGQACFWIALDGKPERSRQVNFRVLSGRTSKGSSYHCNGREVS